MGIDAEVYVLVPEEDATPERIRIAQHALYEYFGHAKFYEPALCLSESRFRSESSQEPGSRILQDGPDEPAAPGKRWIHANVVSRYYGVGYERGDLPFLVMLSRALEHLFPRGQVWYGGDSSGVCATPFGTNERDVLLRHFLESAHRPYNEAFDRGSSSNPKCRTCLVTMGRYGWGRYYASYSCACGERYEVRYGVTTITTVRERREARGQRYRDFMDVLCRRAPDLAAMAQNALLPDID